MFIIKARYKKNPNFICEIKQNSPDASNKLVVCLSCKGFYSKKFKIETPGTLWERQWAGNDASHTS